MIDFLKYRKWCLAFSFLIFAAGVASYFYKGIVFSIDFSGGSELRVSFDEKTDIAQVRAALADAEWTDVAVQGIAGGKDFLVKVSDSSDAVESTVKSVLTESFGEKTFLISSVDRVGPEVSQEVTWNTIFSILVMLLILALYISLRHQYAYALGAVVALAHDVMVLLAYNLVFGEPFSLNTLMGVLLILGYSINDTVVIFASIRKNTGLLGRMSAYEVVNLSLNQTLRRTLLTSFSTLIAVLAIYFLGGEGLRSSAVTMILGIIFGTYSSIYIASPVMMYFDETLGTSRN